MTADLVSDEQLAEWERDAGGLVSGLSAGRVDGLLTAIPLLVQALRDARDEAEQLQRIDWQQEQDLAAAETERDSLRAENRRLRCDWSSPLASEDRWRTEPNPHPRHYLDLHDVQRRYLRAIECSSSGPSPEERAETIDSLLHDVMPLVHWVENLHSDVKAIRAERDSMRAENRHLRDHVAALQDQDERNLAEIVSLGDRIEAAGAIAQYWACDHDGFDAVLAALAAPTGQEKPKHQVEAFRQLIDGTTRVGWQCLTCGIEQLVPDFGPFADQAAEAERQANAHVAAIAGGPVSTGDEETT